MTERATRYLVDIGERRLEICIGAPGGEITVDGEPVNVDLAGVGESDYSVLAVGRSLHMAVESAGEGGRLVVDDGRLTHDVRVQDEREARRSASSARRGSAGDGGLVQASMPGIVTQILVAAGDPVEEDQPLLILEAMKMENEICAESPGTIAVVHVEMGQSVSKGDKLVAIEAAADAEAS